MGKQVSRFNPQMMTEDEILSLATGRQHVLDVILAEMKTCLKPNGNQHFIIYGPRGIGKSFFTRLIQVNHDRAEYFDKSRFILFPEEQNNLTFIADVLDMLSTKLEGGHYNEVKPRWEISDMEWTQSKKRLKKALQEVKKENGIKHVFFTMENLQDFIPRLDDIENGRMREFLSDFDDVSLIGSSLHPEMDNDYNKKLFQVFKKIEIEPWHADDYIEYYNKKLEMSGVKVTDIAKQKVTESRIRSIAKFTGGSPRLAVILNSLIIDDDVLSTMDIMNGIIDELTPYYQDLTKDIPQRSKILFDLLIRLKENITQSDLANQLNPPQEQSTIARSFNWLVENYYVTYIKQKKGNVRHYYVRDRLYVLYYQNREVMADQAYSFVETFVEFLTEFYTEEEWKEKVEKLDFKNKWTKPILQSYAKLKGIEKDIDFQVLDKKFIEYYSSGISFYNQKEHLSAIDCFIKASEISPKFSEPFFCLGKIFTEMGNFTFAVNAYKDAILRSKNNSNAYNNLGVVYYKLKEYKQAIEEYKNAIQIDHNNAEIFYNLGVAYFDLGKFENAIISFEKSLELNPFDQIVINDLGSTYFMINEFEKVIETLSNGIKIHPKSSQLYYNLGITYFNMNKYEEAIEAYKKAIEIGPKNFDLYFSLGNAYTIINYKKDAISIYKECIELEPSISKTYFLIGLILMKANNYNEAIIQLTKFVQLEPLDPKGLFYLGNLYYRLNNYEKSEFFYLSALNLKPENKYYILNITELYISQNRLNEILNLLAKVNFHLNAVEIIAISLRELMSADHATSFAHIIKTFSWITTDHPEWQLDFFRNFSMELYKHDHKALLQDFIDEVEGSYEVNDGIKILIQTWQYILNPDKIDIATLHPDARVAAEVITGVDKS